MKLVFEFLTGHPGTCSKEDILLHVENMLSTIPHPRPFEEGMIDESVFNNGRYIVSEGGLRESGDKIVRMYLTTDTFDTTAQGPRINGNQPDFETAHAVEKRRH